MVKLSNTTHRRQQLSRWLYIHKVYWLSINILKVFEIVAKLNFKDLEYVFSGFFYVYRQERLRCEEIIIWINWHDVKLAARNKKEQRWYHRWWLLIVQKTQWEHRRGQDVSNEWCYQVDGDVSLLPSMYGAVMIRVLWVLLKEMDYSVLLRK